MSARGAARPAGVQARLDAGELDPKRIFGKRPWPEWHDLAQSRRSEIERNEAG
jgi:hypothetical protein